MVDRDNSTFHRTEDYDLQITDTIPYYESFHLESLKLIKTILKEPEFWLDTGCGTGTLVQKAVDEFKKTNFILVDPSVEMLKLARLKLSKFPSKRYKFLEPSETRHISLNANYKLDVITSIQAHHYMSQEERIESTELCYKLLKDNGVYITFENVRHSTVDGVGIAKKYWKNFQTSRGRDEETVDMNLKRFNVEYFPIKIDEHISLLEKTGFRVVELFWMSYMQAGFYCIK